MSDEFASLSKEGLGLLDFMLTLSSPSTISERALFNSRMRYTDSIIAKLKKINDAQVAELLKED